MKFCPQCLKDKPKTDFYIRASRYDGLSCWCILCARVKQREAQVRWNEKHPSGATKATQRWNARNPGAAFEYMRKRRADPSFVMMERGKERAAYREDPEKFRAKTTKWRAENPEKHKQKRADWWDANPGARNASRMKRHAAKLQATPAWADSRYIKLWYAFAKSESERTGIDVEVDHIVPLQSEFVCGLHNDHNMQLLFSNQNKSKGNRAWPDMP